MRVMVLVKATKDSEAGLMPTPFRVSWSAHLSACDCEQDRE